MSFIDTILENFSDQTLFDGGYRALVLGGNAVYIEGVRAILGYDGQEITLSIKKGTLKVKGENLFIKKYCLGDLAICGKITSLEKN